VANKRLVIDTFTCEGTDILLLEDFQDSTARPSGGGGGGGRSCSRSSSMNMKTYVADDRMVTAVA
jgi:hypothetical protein